MKLKIKLLMLLAVLGVLLFSGCHRVKNEVPNSMLTGTTTIAADEALQPLLNAEIGVFQGIYDYASVDCKFVTEYDAINLLLQEKIRLAIVARPLNQKETDFLKSKKIIPESIPLGYDAIALIVNSEVKTAVLTTSEISQILSGDLSDWKQLENSGKTGSIKLVFDTESSGIIRSLNDSLHLNKKISGNIDFAGSSKQLIENIIADPNAIGFVGFNWLSENENMKVQEYLKKVNILAVSVAPKAESTNSFLPSAYNLYNGHYPLIRKIYAIYTDPAASLARGFLAHLTSERGQKIIYRMGLMPKDDFQRLITIKKDF
jgi:phosphate transport system substrate-binding protein